MTRTLHFFHLICAPRLASTQTMEVQTRTEMAVSGMRHQTVINTASLAGGTLTTSTRKFSVARVAEGRHPLEQRTVARRQRQLLKMVSLLSARTLTMVQLTLTITTVWLIQLILAGARKASILSTSMLKTCVAHVAEEIEKNALIPSMAELTLRVAGARTTTQRHQLFLITNTLATMLV